MFTPSKENGVPVPRPAGARLSPLVKSVDQQGRVVRTVPICEAHALRGATLASKGQELVRPRSVHQRLLDILLQPNQTYDDAQIPNLARLFTQEELQGVITEARDLMAQQPTLLYVAAPCRVVSDLHGQFADLMRLFGWCGAPDGSIPWVFLGDYVDRTAFGVEVVMLLYALKCKYKNTIFLLRGNHEIASINSYYGFQGECARKFGHASGDALYRAFNDSFDYLPLAAVAVPPGFEDEPEPLEDDDTAQQGLDSSPLAHWHHQRPGRFAPSRYLLVHGGMGRLETLAEISSLKRPIRTGTGGAAERAMLELVWSDPAPSDDLNGLLTSKRDNYAGGIVSYGADVVERFCERNNITAVLRGHECIQEGLELAFGGRVVTFFSAVSYGGYGDNAGCILHLALTTDEGGRPSIEVQPIRVEAKPRWQPSYSRERCLSAEEDLTDSEPDQRPSRQQQSPWYKNQRREPEEDARQPDFTGGGGWLTNREHTPAFGNSLALTLDISTSGMSSLDISATSMERALKRTQRYQRQKRQQQKLQRAYPSSSPASASEADDDTVVPSEEASGPENSARFQMLMQVPCFQRFGVSLSCAASTGAGGSSTANDADEPSASRGGEGWPDAPTAVVANIGSAQGQENNTPVAADVDLHLHEQRPATSAQQGDSDQGPATAQATGSDCSAVGDDPDDRAMLEAEQSFYASEEPPQNPAEGFTAGIDVDVQGNDSWTIVAAQVAGEAPPVTSASYLPTPTLEVMAHEALDLDETALHAAASSSPHHGSGIGSASGDGPGSPPDVSLCFLQELAQQEGRCDASPQHAPFDSMRPTPPRPSRDAGVFSEQA